MGSIEDRVKKIIMDQFGVEEDEVVPETCFIGDLEADYLDYIEMIRALEEEFTIEIKDEDYYSKIATVQSAYDYIESRTGVDKTWKEISEAMGNRMKGYTVHIKDNHTKLEFNPEDGWINSLIAFCHIDHIDEVVAALMQIKEKYSGKDS